MGVRRLPLSESGQQWTSAQDPFHPARNKWHWHAHCWVLQGRKAEAEAIMEKLADGNGTRMPLEPLADAGAPAAPAAAPPTASIPAAPGTAVGVGGAGVLAAGTAPVVAPAAAEAPLTLGSILKHRNIARRFIVLAYVWCTLWYKAGKACMLLLPLRVQ